MLFNVTYFGLFTLRHLLLCIDLQRFSVWQKRSLVYLEATMDILSIAPRSRLSRYLVSAVNAGFLGGVLLSTPDLLAIFS